MSAGPDATPVVNGVRDAHLELTAPVTAAPPAAAAPSIDTDAATGHAPRVAAVSGARAAPPRGRRPMVGDTLRGRYRVTGIVGQGGMGTIFEVVDQYLTGIAASNRRLAVKMLHTEVTQRPELLRELLTEFLNLQSLSHPNILRVHDFDRDDDHAFFTMELLNGTALGGLVGGRGATPLANGHVRAIVHAVGMALAHAHSRGIVHGDVNPQNIFLRRNGEVRVLDFGASRRLQGNPLFAAAPVVRPLLMATSRYASCEVLEGRAAEATDDLFGLASVAYVLLTGKHPFANRTATEARAEGLKPARPRGLRARQWRALRQGLELRNGRRPTDVGHWVRRLNAGAALRPLPMLCELYSVRPSRTRNSFAAAAAAVLMLASAVGLWMAHVPASPPRFAATARAQAVATFASARTSFVRVWNKTLRSAVIGSEAGAGATGH